MSTLAAVHSLWWLSHLYSKYIIQSQTHNSGCHRNEIKTLPHTWSQFSKLTHGPCGVGYVARGVLLWPAVSANVHANLILIDLGTYHATREWAQGYVREPVGGRGDFGLSSV